MFFLDTNICIYFLKGQYPGIRTRLSVQFPQDVKIAAMVKAELLYGAEKSDRSVANREKALQFMAPFEIVPFDDAAAEAYARIRSQTERAGTSVGSNDLIIAATVLARDGVLVTHNEKEFKRISGLAIENWTIAH